MTFLDELKAVNAKPQPSQMACDISTASMRNVAAQLCRGNWLAERMLRLPKEQASCRSFAQVLGSAVGTTRVVTLVHASPRIYRRPISEAPQALVLGCTLEDEWVGLMKNFKLSSKRFSLEPRRVNKQMKRMRKREAKLG
ncbi:hypothetical protein LI328DRAFT_157992 [Trichoderma asperelloides]|nr:hypothetical protein LI328DRAFT_157992 [Trichoderma asperelloides]